MTQDPTPSDIYCSESRVRKVKAKSLKYKVNINLGEKGGSQEMESEGSIKEGNKLKITLEERMDGQAMQLFKPWR